jgi:hypothetical protein
VALFGRRKPLHRRLADAAGLTLDGGLPPQQGLASAPPGWDGEQRGEPGIHGVPRPRRWDAVASVEAPELRGDELAFVVLPDGTVVLDGDQPEGAVTPLAEAVEATLKPPYRAEAVRRGPQAWAVAARRIAVVRQPGLSGEEAELVSQGGDRRLVVDGRSVLERAPSFEAAGEQAGADYVVRGTRLDGDLWEIAATPL